MNRRNAQPKRNSADQIAEECLAVRIRLLSRTITAIYDDALRPLGITVGQLNVLVIVAQLGPIAPGDVARKLSMEKSTVSRNIERMRIGGWLEISPGETGRSQSLSLARDGKAMLETARPRWEEAQDRAQEMLGKNGARSILRVADSVWSRLGAE